MEIFNFLLTLVDWFTSTGDKFLDAYLETDKMPTLFLHSQLDLGSISWVIGRGSSDPMKNIDNDHFVILQSSDWWVKSGSIQEAYHNTILLHRGMFLPGGCIYNVFLYSIFVFEIYVFFTVFHGMWDI